MVTEQEAYNILGLKPGASPKEVLKKYRELALEWYPQKHNYSALSNQKFKDISQSYVLLSRSGEKIDEKMSMTDMLDIFQKAFFGDDYVMPKDDDLDDSYDDLLNDDDDYSDSDESYGSGPSLFPNFAEFVGVISAEVRASGASAKKAMQNASELIADEEKEKRKAAKRKAKKKRRKLKKKLEKDSAQKKSEEESRLTPNRSESNDYIAEVEEEGLDPNSAFVAVSVSKSKGSTQIHPKKDIKQTCTNGSEEHEENVQDINPQVLQSRELAIRGNMMANIGEFQCAIGLFMDAIKLDPTEFKYFCNRSYCYHQLNQFERALKDAEKAITLQPTWPKGYFRKGQALTGLQRFQEAEVYFRKVLALDKNCGEAIQELKRTQTCQLMEMGFSQHQSELALDEHVNLQEATEALLNGAFPHSPSKATTNGHHQIHQFQLQQSVEEDDDEIYMSDEEDSLSNQTPLCQTTHSIGGPSSNGAPSQLQRAAAPNQPLRTVAHLAAPSKGQITALSKAGGSDFKQDVRNPEGRTSLWVGNVKAQVTEKMLMNLFSKYGELISIRLLPDRRCAFINFKDKKAAGKAMESLQGYECCGECFLIRFPDKTHAFGQSFVMKKKGYQQQSRR